MYRKKVTEEDRIELCKKISYQEYFDKIILPERSDYYYAGADLTYNRKCCCPLHDEDTPSFFLYDKDMQGYFLWRCFGACSTGGDIIKLHMLYMQKYHDREKYSYWDAYWDLKNIFIDGREYTAQNGASKIVLEREKDLGKNSVEDLIPYYNIRSQVATSLKLRQLDDELKKTTYNLLDSLDIAVLKSVMSGQKASKDLYDYAVGSGILVKAQNTPQKIKPISKI